MNVMILGASGMLGHTVVRVMAESGSGHRVVAVGRSLDIKSRLSGLQQVESVSGVDVENTDHLMTLFSTWRPDVVVNAIGLVKQRADANDPLSVLPINALLPHRLSQLCDLVGARLVHVSTDCVFDGARGGYREDDVSDATDLYGKSKYIGEVSGPNAITLRTSIIGHELRGAQGLVEWFLSQQGMVKGFRNVVFSGLPTVELARVIRDVVLPRPDLYGVYHVAAAPISKFDLLCLVAKTYRKEIDIVPDDLHKLDRSLDATKLREATGYVAPAWPDLITLMYQYK